MLIKLVSTAQTGFFYTKVKKRGGPTLSLMKYDAQGKKYIASQIGNTFLIVFKSAAGRHVLFKERKMK